MAGRARSTRSDRVALAGMRGKSPSQLKRRGVQDSIQASEFDNGSNFETFPQAIESGIGFGERDAARHVIIQQQVTVQIAFCKRRNPALGYHHNSIVRYSFHPSRTATKADPLLLCDLAEPDDLPSRPHDLHADLESRFVAGRFKKHSPHRARA